MARRLSWISTLVLAVILEGLAAAADAPQLIASFGKTGPGALAAPYGVALGDGFVYVSDQFHYRIVKFTQDGQFVSAWGSQGSGPGQFGQTIGLALDGLGRLFVVDYGNSRVESFTTDGAFVTQWGSSGGGPGQFSAPRRLMVDQTGLVQVTDFGNNRIEAFTRDGVFRYQWGLGQLDDPRASLKVRTAASTLRRKAAPPIE